MKDIDTEETTMISIHALREEGDAAPARLDPTTHHFYPRPPRGGRHFEESDEDVFILFLSTPSARRATDRGWNLWPRQLISIHALREEGDGITWAARSQDG